MIENNSSLLPAGKNGHAIQDICSISLLLCKTYFVVYYKKKKSHFGNFECGISFVSMSGKFGLNVKIIKYSRIILLDLNKKKTGYDSVC